MTKLLVSPPACLLCLSKQRLMTFIVPIEGQMTRSRKFKDYGIIALIHNFGPDCNTD